MTKHRETWEPSDHMPIIPRRIVQFVVLDANDKVIRSGSMSWSFVDDSDVAGFIAECCECDRKQVYLMP